MILNGLPWKRTEIILSVLRLHTGTAFKTLVDHDVYSIASKGFLPTVVYIIVIWVKFTHFSPCSLLIPRMSMFTLAISYLTTSNLPWFLDLTFLVPMQYCSLQHWHYFHHQSHPRLGVVFTLALSFHSFWTISPFFSHSLLGTYRPGKFIFQCPIFFVFSYCSWGSQGKNTDMACHSLLTGPHFFRTLHCDLSVLGGPMWHGS